MDEGRHQLERVRVAVGGHAGVTVAATVVDTAAVRCLTLRAAGAGHVVGVGAGAPLGMGMGGEDMQHVGQQGLWVGVGMAGVRS